MSVAGFSFLHFADLEALPTETLISGPWEGEAAGSSEPKETSGRSVLTVSSLQCRCRDLAFVLQPCPNRWGWPVFSPKSIARCGEPFSGKSPFLRAIQVFLISCPLPTDALQGDGISTSLVPPLANPSAVKRGGPTIAGAPSLSSSKGPASNGFHPTYGRRESAPRKN